jgi:hypothetical protein
MTNSIGNHINIIKKNRFSGERKPPLDHPERKDNTINPQMQSSTSLSSDLDNTINPQMQSPFFSKLPPKIHNQIVYKLSPGNYGTFRTLCKRNMIEYPPTIDRVIYEILKKELSRKRIPYNSRKYYEDPLVSWTNVATDLKMVSAFAEGTLYKRVKSDLDQIDPKTNETPLQTNLNEIFDEIKESIPTIMNQLGLGSHDTKGYLIDSNGENVNQENYPKLHEIKVHENRLSSIIGSYNDIITIARAEKAEMEKAEKEKAEMEAAAGGQSHE